MKGTEGLPRAPPLCEGGHFPPGSPDALERGTRGFPGSWTPATSWCRFHSSREHSWSLTNNFLTLRWYKSDTQLYLESQIWIFSQAGDMWYKPSRDADRGSQPPVSYVITRVKNPYTYNHPELRQPNFFSLPAQYSIDAMNYSILYYK